MALTRPAEGKHGAPAPLRRVEVTRRGRAMPDRLAHDPSGCYRTDHHKQRIKATINVIASLRSGVATMVRMPGYVG